MGPGLQTTSSNVTQKKSIGKWLTVKGELLVNVPALDGRLVVGDEEGLIGSLLLPTELLRVRRQLSV